MDFCAGIKTIPGRGLLFRHNNGEQFLEISRWGATYQIGVHTISRIAFVPIGKAILYSVNITLDYFSTVTTVNIRIHRVFTA